MIRHTLANARRLLEKRAAHHAKAMREHRDTESTQADLDEACLIFEEQAGPEVFS